MDKSKKNVKVFYDEFHNRCEHQAVNIMNEERYLFLKDLVKNEKGTMLIVGCGSRDEMSIIGQNCDGFGIDISENAVEKSKKKYPQFTYCVADAQKIPFEDKKFDCIVCSEVIEHVPNDELFISEAYRLLKSGGKLIITTPNWLSWYGIARWLGESIFKKPFTSGDQPIDHWYTYGSLKSKVEKLFVIKRKWGLWFYPPFGKGKLMVPEFIAVPAIHIFFPINKLLRKPLFSFGHMLAFELIKR